MTLYERDPRDTGFIALYIAATWFEELSPDKARRIALGRVRSRPGVSAITPEAADRIRAIIGSPNFHNVGALVKRFRVNKYDVYRLIGGNDAKEEAVVVSKVQALLFRLKNTARECTAVDCEKCILNGNIYGDLSLCDFLENLQFDKDGRLVSVENMDVAQVSHRCPTKFSGETMHKTFRVHKEAVEKIQGYLEKRPGNKVQDVISEALVEYVERREG